MIIPVLVPRGCDHSAALQYSHLGAIVPWIIIPVVEGRPATEGLARADIEVLVCLCKGTRPVCLEQRKTIALHGIIDLALVAGMLGHNTGAGPWRYGCAPAGEVARLEAGVDHCRNKLIQCEPDIEIHRISHCEIVFRRPRIRQVPLDEQLCLLPRRQCPEGGREAHFVPALQCLCYGRVEAEFTAGCNNEAVRQLPVGVE